MMFPWPLLWPLVFMTALIACGGASTVRPPSISPLPPTRTNTTSIVAPLPTSAVLEPTSQATAAPASTISASSPTGRPTPAAPPTPKEIAPTTQTEEQPQEGSPVASNELRYLALGDSYTIGQSVEVSERWPVQLVQLLRDDGVIMSDPEIVARTGWTTGELAAGIAQANPVGTFDLVTLLIGVNNQFRGLDIEQYRREFSELLQQSVNFAGEEPSHLIVVSTPDWGVTPFARGLDQDRIAREIDQFNSVAFEEAERARAIFVDVTGISRLAATQPDLLAPDGLHPSGVMYSQWVDLIFPAAQSIATEASTSAR